MKPTTIPTNKQIVGGFNRQEKWVIPWLVDRCEASVYEIASKILKNDVDAEAVTGDVFLKLYFMEERKKAEHPGTLKTTPKTSPPNTNSTMASPVNKQIANNQLFDDFRRLFVGYSSNPLPR